MAQLKATWTPDTGIEDQVVTILRDGNSYGDPVYLGATTGVYFFDGLDYPEADYEVLVRGRKAQIQATVTEVETSGSGGGGGE